MKLRHIWGSAAIAIGFFIFGYPALADYVTSGLSTLAPSYLRLQNYNTTDMAKVDAQHNLHTALCDVTTGTNCAIVSLPGVHDTPLPGFVAVGALQVGTDTDAKHSKLYNSTVANGTDLANKPMAGSVPYLEYLAAPGAIATGQSYRAQGTNMGELKVALSSGGVATFGTNAGTPIFVGPGTSMTFPVSQSTASLLNVTTIPSTSQAATRWETTRLSADGTNFNDATHPIYTQPATSATTAVTQSTSPWVVSANGGTFAVTESGTWNVGLSAGSNLVGKMGIDQTTPGTTNGVQVNAALPTGANVIGAVTQSGTWNIGTVTTITNAVPSNADTTIGGTSAPSKLFLMGGKTNDGTPAYDPLPLSPSGKGLRTIEYGTSWASQSITVTTTGTAITRLTGARSGLLKNPSANTQDICVKHVQNDSCASGSYKLEPGESLPLNVDSTTGVFLSVASSTATVQFIDTAE